VASTLLSGLVELLEERFSAPSERPANAPNRLVGGQRKPIVLSPFVQFGEGLLQER